MDDFKTGPPEMGKRNVWTERENQLNFEAYDQAVPRREASEPSILQVLDAVRIQKAMHRRINAGAGGSIRRCVVDRNYLDCARRVDGVRKVKELCTKLSMRK